MGKMAEYMGVHPQNSRRTLGKSGGWRWPRELASSEYRTTSEERYLHLFVEGNAGMMGVGGSLPGILHF